VSSAGLTTAPLMRPHIVTQSGLLRRRRTANALVLGLTGFMTLLALVPLFWIIGYVVYKGGHYINLSFFINMPTPLGVEGGGVLHAIQGTIILTILSTLMAMPVGLLAGIFASRNPRHPLSLAVRFSTDVLAGVPSIVVGLFGYALIVKAQGHFSALAGGAALSILMLPIIIRTTEEMINLVPKTLREGSLALGAAEWKTTLSVVIPAAANGLITGFLLGLARASGETAPLLFTALGNERLNAWQMVSGGIAAGQNPISAIIQLIEQPVDSLPLTLFKYSQQPYPERINQAWAVALVLMMMVLLVNIAARLWVEYRTARLQG
jgi:phosphate transport system permease protein